MRQIERDIDSLVKRRLQTENERTIFAHEQRITAPDKEKALIEEEASRLATPAHSFDEMFERSMRFLSSPYDIWKKGDLETKKAVLRLVYSEPMIIDREKGVQTAETTFPFKALRFMESSDMKMVPAAGLEPARPEARDFKSPVSTVPPRGHALATGRYHSGAGGGVKRV